MKKNKQARIKISLIVLVASALIGGITVNQISATSTSDILDTTATYRDDSFDSLSAKQAQESLASTQQQKRTELEKQKKAQELKEQEAAQEQAEKAKIEQEQNELAELKKATQEQEVSQTQETVNVQEQTTSQQTSNLQTTDQAQNTSTVPEVAQEQEAAQQPVTQEATQRTATPQTNPQPQIPSAGLYIDGICAQIGSYNVDGGQVPTYTPLAYHWNTPQMAAHNYYLVDNSNSTGLGQKVLALQIGDPVYLNGHLYHVTSSVTVYPGQYASDYFDFSHGLYIQTCYGASASEGMRTVILD